MHVQRSAGVLVYRRRTASGIDVLEVLLGHMGGPYWARRQDAAWTVPKGLVEPGEDDWAAAQREFAEETGHPVPAGPVTDLGVFRQNRSKEVHIWAVRGDITAASCASNTFEMQWPPKSGQIREFAELDRFEWLDLHAARSRIVVGQQPVLEALDSLDELSVTAADSAAFTSDLQNLGD